MAPRLSFAGFKDPASRPRYIIWTAVAVLALAAVVIIALGVTSTRWFCAEGCHKVQDDTIAAYDRSPHAKISCMACHMPVNANPIIFVLHKAEALGELAMTVTNNYELPLNAESEVALNMKSTQCTQCHDPEKRPVTPSVGIVIDHQIHADKKVTCGICHNRTAHVEDFELTLTDPKTGKPNKKHEDFMKMTACFRCHSQEKGTDSAPGACSACHTPKFKLKPASHNRPGFFPKGHAELAALEESRVALAGGKPWLSAEESSESAGEEPAAEGEATGEKETLGESLPKVETINECSTCHSRSFCTDCHGVPMPHPPTFTKTHGTVGKKDPTVCVKCHGPAATFCNECHHGTSMDLVYDRTKPWRTAHPTAVKNVGASACFACHNPTYCANCHVNGSTGN
jgi:hypothetical protein